MRVECDETDRRHPEPWPVCPPDTTAAEHWRDARIGGPVWLVPPGFLAGAVAVAGLPVIRVPDLDVPYLAHPVERAA